FDPQQLPLRGLESWRLNSPPSYTFSQNSSAFLANMARAQAGSGKVTLFQQKTPGGLTYRIPALLYLPSESTFLAFAEERSTPRDEDAKFLVMRRGQKEGMSVQVVLFPRNCLTAFQELSKAHSVAENVFWEPRSPGLESQAPRVEQWVRLEAGTEGAVLESSCQGTAGAALCFLAKSDRGFLASQPQASPMLLCPFC
uniref:Uncharacterized protein n=1 Tax=Varanus komodoensis TaxID=61221 RepID=A0A8D2KVM2_VARKO